jgi:hypothetical protein
MIRQSKTIAAPIAVRKRTSVDWSIADDQSLVAAMIDHDDGAWRACDRRYGATIDKRIWYVLGLFWSQLQSNDLFDEVKADYHFALLANDMGRLRLYDARGGTLKRWLSIIAKQVALKHIMRVCGRPIELSLEQVETEENQARQRGAGWIGKDQPLDALYFDELRGEPIPKEERRRRKRLRKRGVIE